tara:strand:- start:366 stop:554 length:189 start_codon:yes stop_codon:yes gene_type:complete
MSNYANCTDCITIYSIDELYGGMYLFNKNDTAGEITPNLYNSDDFLCGGCIDKREDQERKIK